MVVTHVYHACSTLVMDFYTQVDWIILEMLDFDIILGITWLFINHAIPNYNAKIVTLEIPVRSQLGLVIYIFQYM